MSTRYRVGLKAQLGLILAVMVMTIFFFSLLPNLHRSPINMTVLMILIGIVFVIFIVVYICLNIVDFRQIIRMGRR